MELHGRQVRIDYSTTHSAHAPSELFDHLFEFFSSFDSLLKHRVFIWVNVQ
jgi:hypothetical protein